MTAETLLNPAVPPARGPKPLTPKQIKAVKLLAQALLSYPAVASKVGVCRDTLLAWRQFRHFQEAVEAERKIVNERIRLDGIADIDNRIQRQEHDRDMLRQVIAERRDYWTARLSDVITKLPAARKRMETLKPAADAAQSDFANWLKTYSFGAEKSEIENRRNALAIETREYTAAASHLEALERDPAHHPGITTGEVVYRQEATRFGIVDLFETDTATLSELARLEASVEKTLGQAAPVKSIHEHDFSAMSDADLEREIEAAKRGAAAAAAITAGATADSPG